MLCTRQFWQMFEILISEEKRKEKKEEEEVCNAKITYNLVLSALDSSIITDTFMSLL